MGLRRPLSGLRARLEVRSGLAQLRAGHDQAAVLLAEAIRETVDGELLPQERDLIAQIEDLRGTLEASTADISIVDYGAGTPGLDLSEDAMDRGRIVHRTVGELCRSASKPPAWSLLLFKLVRKFRPAVGVELGTCLGISAAYQAAAMQLNGHGELLTLEGSEALAELARLHLKGLGLDNATVVTGRFRDSLPAVLAACPSVDYAFIDGHHDEKATVDYYRQFMPALPSRGVLVFDDIAWSDGMRRAWRAIRSDEQIRLSVDLGPVGIGVAGDRKSPSGGAGDPFLPKHAVTIPLGSMSRRAPGH